MNRNKAQRLDLDGGVCGGGDHSRGAFFTGIFARMRFNIKNGALATLAKSPEAPMPKRGFLMNTISISVTADNLSYQDKHVNAYPSNPFLNSRLHLITRCQNRSFSAESAHCGSGEVLQW